MSGHSKWAKLKHVKGKIDAQKSSLFTKLGHAITIAARLGGNDPETNFRLRLAIDKAKQANVSKDVIERAVKRGAGAQDGAQIEEELFEVIAPNGVMILIEALTDNKNRTVSSIKGILNHYHAALGQKNSVAWMFDRKGIIKIQKMDCTIPFDALMLKAIDYGALDVEETNDEINIYTAPEHLQKVKESLERDTIKIAYAEVEWFGKNPITITVAQNETVEKLYAEFDDDPDINDYYSNIGKVE